MANNGNGIDLEKIVKDMKFVTSGDYVDDTVVQNIAAKHFANALDENHKFDKKKAKDFTKNTAKDLLKHTYKNVIGEKNYDEIAGKMGDEMMKISPLEH